MNKKELAAETARRTGIERDDADAAVTVIFDIIAERLAAGEEVRLSGFGTFGVKERPAREGRNPATGVPIPIPAARVPKFRPGKSLKSALNRGTEAQKAINALRSEAEGLTEMTLDDINAEISAARAERRSKV